MEKTLPYEHLDVGASEKTIQSILSFSKATAHAGLPEEHEALNEIFNN